jgi:hypothetical protein
MSRMVYETTIQTTIAAFEWWNTAYPLDSLANEISSLYDYEEVKKTLRSHTAMQHIVSECLFDLHAASNRPSFLLYIVYVSNNLHHFGRLLSTKPTE